MTNLEDIALDLHLLMDHVSESDRCTLCKAAELIEKQNTSSNWNSSFWIILIFMLTLGNGSIDISLDDITKAYLETIKKTKEADNEPSEMHPDE